MIEREQGVLKRFMKGIRLPEDMTPLAQSHRKVKNGQVRILFLKVGALGDVLMTTPLVRATRKAYPYAELIYYTGAWSACALERNPYLDRVEMFPDEIFFKKSRAAELVSLLLRLRREKANILFCLDKARLFNFFCAGTQIPIRVGFDRAGEGYGLTKKVPYNKAKHDISYYLDLLAALQGKKIRQTRAHDGMDLSRTAQDNRAAAKHLRRIPKKRGYIALLPGGGRNPGQAVLEKRWPLQKFKTLAGLLKEKGYAPLIIGGASDLDLVQAFADIKVPCIVGKTTIQESAAIIDLCAWTICNDSGPMHIAATTRTRIIALFGPTDPRRLAPLGSRHIVLKAQKAPTYHNGTIAQFARSNAGIRAWSAITPQAILKIIFKNGKR